MRRHTSAARFDDWAAVSPFITVRFIVLRRIYRQNPTIFLGSVFLMQNPEDASLCSHRNQGVFYMGDFSLDSDKNISFSGRDCSYFVLKQDVNAPSFSRSRDVIWPTPLYGVGHNIERNCCGIPLFMKPFSRPSLLCASAVLPPMHIKKQRALRLNSVRALLLPLTPRCGVRGRRKVVAVMGSVAG